MSTPTTKKRKGHDQSPLSRAAAIRNWKLKQLACVVSILRKDLDVPYIAEELEKTLKTRISFQWETNKMLIARDPTFMPKWR